MTVAFKTYSSRPPSGASLSMTTSAERRADADTEEMFNKQIIESSSKKSGMSEE
jgi:hypothetical protein